MEEQKKNNKRKNLSKSDWIGAIVGFSIAVIIFQFNNFGFILAFAIAYGSYWIVKQIALLFIKEEDDKEKQEIKKEKTEVKENEIENDEQYKDFIKRNKTNVDGMSDRKFKIVIFIIITIIIIAIIAHLIFVKASQNVLNSTKKEEVNSNKELSQSDINMFGFQRYYGSEEDIKFSLLFPTSDLLEEPNRMSFDINSVNSVAYQSYKVFGSVSDMEAAMYSITFQDLKENESFYEENKDLYFENIGEISSLLFGEGELMYKNRVDFKDFDAVKFAFYRFDHGTKIIHKRLTFLFEGKPITLSVVYPEEIGNEFDIYFDEFVDSLTIESKT